MEYPNLVMISNVLEAEFGDDSLLKIVVAHEVAHQWFYGMVGDNQFTEAWLDESFASYSEEDAFREAIKAYFKDYSMKIATTEDFIQGITKYAPDNQEVEQLLQKYLKE